MKFCYQLREALAWPWPPSQRRDALVVDGNDRGHAQRLFGRVVVHPEVIDAQFGHPKRAGVARDEDEDPEHPDQTEKQGAKADTAGTISLPSDQMSEVVRRLRQKLIPPT